MLQKNLKPLEKERLTFIDKASGFAILLVVYGHIEFPETRHINWYWIPRKFIYEFHMPLFMCLSGYISFLSTTSKEIKSKSEFINFQKKKLNKFLPPYFIFSLTSILVDFFLHHAPLKEINNSIFYTFFSPVKGSAKFVWYLYVLMGFYLITPFLTSLKSNIQYLLLAFAFLLTNSSFSALFSANLFCKYFFFFFCGGLIYLHKDEFLIFLRRNGKWIVLLTVFLSILDFFVLLIIPFQLLCLAIIPSVLYISMLDWPKTISEIFITMGVSSFAIYLLNTSVLN